MSRETDLTTLAPAKTPKPVSFTTTVELETTSFLTSPHTSRLASAVWSQKGPRDPYHRFRDDSALPSLSLGRPVDD